MAVRHRGTGAHRASAYRQPLARLATAAALRVARHDAHDDRCTPSKLSKRKPARRRRSRRRPEADSPPVLHHLSRAHKDDRGKVLDGLDALQLRVRRRRLVRPLVPRARPRISLPRQARAGRRSARLLLAGVRWGAQAPQLRGIGGGADRGDPDVAHRWRRHGLRRHRRPDPSLVRAGRRELSRPRPQVQLSGRRRRAGRDVPVAVLVGRARTHSHHAAGLQLVPDLPPDTRRLRGGQRTIHGLLAPTSLATLASTLAPTLAGTHRPAAATHITALHRPACTARRAAAAQPAAPARLSASASGALRGCPLTDASPHLPPRRWRV